ncbi:transcription-repair-coupling factor [Alsobacter metallidurans]|uniref:Transcription-repair-coupling factor n=1 Tax=Alsobacter metallidurans TaxID=340221 RepID=A0A917I444_9HYPH|nr:DEAD/DEAH box helicase [Alsobacter metallidurans]GGH07356.1 transcription-repair-coupling factor [Alsobacter metallidurans]
MTASQSAALEAAVAEIAAAPDAAPTLSVPPQPAALALALLDAAGDHPGGVLFVAGSERQAEEVGRLAEALAVDQPVLRWPAWDSLPFDLAPPSAAVMGRRAAVLGRLAQGVERALVVTTAEAMLQRVPPLAAWRDEELTLRAGDAVDPEALRLELERRGYWSDERVDEPGEFGIRGGVVDIFPADADRPVRLDHEDGRITEIRRFDPVSQRTLEKLAAVTLVAASEDFTFAAAPANAGQEGDTDAGASARDSFAQRVLAAHPELAAPLALLDGARVLLSPEAPGRAEAFLELVADGGSRAGAGLFLGADAWEALADRATVLEFTPDADSAAPNFAGQRLPEESAARFLRAEREAGRTVVLAAPSRTWLRDLRRLAAAALDVDVQVAPSWDAVRAAGHGAIFLASIPADKGFRLADPPLTMLTAADLYGSRARVAAQAAASAAVLAGPDLRCGDVVVHRDHGLAVLEDVETVETPGGATETIRLRFADNKVLLVPADEAGRLWRYGSDPDTVSLDRLGGEAWEKRRAEIDAQIHDTAARIAALALERAARTAETLVPPRAAYERFAAGFPYPETPDQSRAIEEALADLASGRPMNRLVCGDVGFGKTEVALRAAAAAALAGKQVAVAAPTTVLARQHLTEFTRRFARMGVRVAGLSRFTSAAEAREVKQGLADGSVRVVIGTHALASKDVRFSDLGLLIIDEEQRFGSRHKAALAALGENVHVLTMTATPIPRTLQSAMAGLRSLSVIATPPAARVPVRAVIQPFDETAIRDALLRERRRDGQSFVVCPRVEDIEPMRARLAEIWPEATVLVAHGKQKPAEIDDALIRFSDGDGDVLLATNIVESGLDIPNANTMVVWRPDRFGLAQLHQLRGRVGRGRRRGVFVMATDPRQKLGAGARKRLETLAALDRLGAGFAISARDLDHRGAGDLLGEDQSGHMRLIGAALYQDLLERAVLAARGEPVEEDWTPAIGMADPGAIPVDYIPEPDVRLELYVRLVRARGEADLAALSDEIADRFGDPPETVERLLERARLAVACRTLDVSRLDMGPQAIAASFRTGDEPPAWVAKVLDRIKEGPDWKNGRLVWPVDAPTPAGQRARARKLLAWLQDGREKVG